MEMVSFGWPFAELEDMFEHNQFVFYRAAVLIPSISDSALADLAERAQMTSVDNDWQNKLVYLRVSLDCPIILYPLRGTGLFGGQAIYEGPTLENPGEKIFLLNHITMAQPGVTIGVEVQPLDFLSVEFNIKAGFGDPYDLYYLNLAAGLELKFNIKTQYLMIQPYGTFVFHLSPLFAPSPAFTEDGFPLFEYGLGVQFSIRAGSSGILFVNLGFLTSVSDIFMENQYKDNNGNKVWPNPPQIHYGHSLFGDIFFGRFVFALSIGYRHGFISR
jgi:hypothetical protein